MSKRGIDPTILLPNFFLLFLVAFGIVSRHESLESIRPPSSAEARHVQEGDQIKARAWEDPLAVRHRIETNGLRDTPTLENELETILLRGKLAYTGETVGKSEIELAEAALREVEKAFPWIEGMTASDLSLAAEELVKVLRPSLTKRAKHSEPRSGGADPESPDADLDPAIVKELVEVLGAGANPDTEGQLGEEEVQAAVARRKAAFDKATELLRKLRSDLNYNFQTTVKKQALSAAVGEIVELLGPRGVDVWRQNQSDVENSLDRAAEITFLRAAKSSEAGGEPLATLFHATIEEALSRGNWKAPEAQDLPYLKFERAAVKKAEAFLAMIRSQAEITIAVMVNGGFEPDAIERRIRKRQAVLAAMDQAQYLPTDSSRMHFVEVDFGGAADAVFVAEDFVPASFLPVSAKEKRRIFRDIQRNYDRVRVVYLDPDEIKRAWNLAVEANVRTGGFSEAWGETVSSITSGGLSELDILGPASSESLLELLPLSFPRDYKQNKIDFFSQSASLETDLILSKLRGRVANPEEEDWDFEPQAKDNIRDRPWIYRMRGLKIDDADELLSKDYSEYTLLETQEGVVALLHQRWDPLIEDSEKQNRKRVHFEPMILTDSELADALVEELAARGVLFNEKSDRIVLISESDKIYGSAFPLTFRKSVARHLGIPGKDSEEADFIGIDHVSYLRGLDGRSVLQKNAGDGRRQAPLGENELASLQKALNVPSILKAEPAPDWRPEGTQQYDRVRAVAQELKARGRVVAVGVVGSDPYDKLVVLQALRTALPRAIFFSTDLDANMLTRENFPITRNLVVASSFGLQCEADELGGVMPFRDGYQTATYHAALHSLVYYLKKARWKRESNDGGIRLNRLILLNRSDESLLELALDPACGRLSEKLDAAIPPTSRETSSERVALFREIVEGVTEEKRKEFLRSIDPPLLYDVIKSLSPSTLVRLAGGAPPDVHRRLLLDAGAPGKIETLSLKWDDSIFVLAGHRMGAVRFRELVGNIQAGSGGQDALDVIPKELSEDQQSHNNIPPWFFRSVFSRDGEGYSEFLRNLPDGKLRALVHGADPNILRDAVLGLNPCHLRQFFAKGAKDELRNTDISPHFRHATPSLVEIGIDGALPLPLTTDDIWTPKDWNDLEPGTFGKSPLPNRKVLNPVSVPTLVIIWSIFAIVYAVLISGAGNRLLPRREDTCGFAFWMVALGIAVWACVTARSGLRPSTLPVVASVLSVTGVVLYSTLQILRVDLGKVILIGLVVIGSFSLVASAYSAHYTPGEEPFGLFDGVSVWSTEILRFIGLSLGGYYCTLAVADLRSALLNTSRLISRRLSTIRSTLILRNERETRFLEWMRNYLLRFLMQTGSAGYARFDLTTPGIYGNRFTAVVNTPGRFAAACAIGFVVLFTGAVCFFAILGKPPAPIRGQIAATLDTWILAGNLILLYLLASFAILANLLCLYGLVRPGEKAWKIARKDPDADPHDTARFYLQTIAVFSSSIRRLPLYPCLMIFLLILSRNGRFDNWGMPAVIVAVIFYFIGILVAVNATLNYRAVHLRDQMGDDLRYNAAAKIRDSQQVGEVPMIHSLAEGAFGGITKNPVLRALLIPIGGGSLIALIELLASTSL